jgi:hypothetical protein
MTIKELLYCGKCQTKKNGKLLEKAVSTSAALLGKKTFVGLYDFNGDTYEVYLTMKKQNKKQKEDV